MQIQMPYKSLVSVVPGICRGRAHSSVSFPHRRHLIGMHSADTQKCMILLPGTSTCLEARAHDMGGSYLFPKKAHEGSSGRSMTLPPSNPTSKGRAWGLGAESST